MKKIITVLLIAVFATLFFGCSVAISSENENKISESENKETETEVQEEYAGDIYGNAVSYNPNVMFSVNDIPALMEDLMEDDNVSVSPWVDKSIISTIGSFVVDKGKEMMLNMVDAFLKEQLSDTAGAEYDWLKDLLGYKEDDTEIIDRMNLLADAIEAVDYKLDLVLDQVKLSEMRTLMNSKIERETAISNISGQYLQNILLIMSTDEEKIDKDEKVERIKAALKKWGSLTVDSNPAHLNASRLLDLHMHTYSFETPMTYLDIYNAISKSMYGWEHQGYDFRETMQCSDMAILAREVVMATMYYKLVDKLNPDNIDNLTEKFNKYKGLTLKKTVIRDNNYIICQISGVNKKFKKKMLNNYSYAGIIGSYEVDLAWYESVPSDANLRDSGVKNKIYKGLKRSDKRSPGSVKYLRSDEYKKILAFYGNNKTLYEIFADEAGFEMEEEWSANNVYFLPEDGHMDYKRYSSTDRDPLLITGYLGTKTDISGSMEEIRACDNHIRWGFSGTWVESAGYRKISANFISPIFID